jgi:hypothetical protein
VKLRLSAQGWNVISDVSKQGTGKKYTRGKFTGRKRKLFKENLFFYQLQIILKVIQSRKVA